MGVLLCISLHETEVLESVCLPMPHQAQQDSGSVVPSAIRYVSEAVPIFLTAKRPGFPFRSLTPILQGVTIHSGFRDEPVLELRCVSVNRKPPPMVGLLHSRLFYGRRSHGKVLL